MGNETDMALALQTVREIDAAFERSERLRLGRWVLPNEREQTLASFIVKAFTTIRQEERRAAFKDAIAAVPQVGVTFPEGYEEWIDAPSYRESVIAALEAAANETKGEDGDDAGRSESKQSGAER